MAALNRSLDTLALIPYLMGYQPKHELILCGLDSGMKTITGKQCLGPIFQYDYREGIGLECIETVASIIREHAVTTAIIALYCECLDEMRNTELYEQLQLLHFLVKEKQAPGSFLAIFALDTQHYLRVDQSEDALPLRELTEREKTLESVYEREGLPSYGRDVFRSKDAVLCPSSARLRGFETYLDPHELKQAIGNFQDFRGRKVEEKTKVLYALMRQWEKLYSSPSVHEVREKDGDLGGQRKAQAGCQPAQVEKTSLQKVGEKKISWEKIKGIHTEEFGNITVVQAVEIASGALQNTQVRDSTLLWALAKESYSYTEFPQAEEIAHNLEKISEEKPCISWLEHSSAFLDGIAQHTYEGSDEALAMNSYVHWWMGRNRTAYQYACVSLERSPNNNLAALMVQALSEGLMPPWYEHYRLGRWPI